MLGFRTTYIKQYIQFIFEILSNMSRKKIYLFVAFYFLFTLDLFAVASEDVEPGTFPSRNRKKRKKCQNVLAFPS